MPYVETTDGPIIVAYAMLQAGYAEEFVGAAIEALRLGGKATVAAAITVEDVQAVISGASLQTFSLHS